MNHNRVKEMIKPLIVLIIIISLSIVSTVNASKISSLGGLGYFGMAILLFLNNASLLFPGPGLMAVFTVGNALPNPWLTGIAAGIGATAGEMVGYIAGVNGRKLIQKQLSFERVESLVSKYGLFAIFFLAIIPNPIFDLVGLAAGTLNIKWWKFMLAAGAGILIKTTVISLQGAAILH